MEFDLNSAFSKLMRNFFPPTGDDTEVLITTETGEYCKCTSYCYISLY